MSNHKFKLISLIFPVKITNSNQFIGFCLSEMQISIYLKKNIYKHTNSKKKFLIFPIKITNSNKFTGFF